MRAYDDWVRVKDMRDQSIRCLDLKSKPRLVVVPAHDDLRGSQTSLVMTTRRSQSSIVSGGGGGGGAVAGNLITINTTNPMRSKENRDVIEFCIDVGKALKKVDRCVRIEMMMMIILMMMILMMIMMMMMILMILKAHHHPSIYLSSIHLPSIYRTTFREWSSWCDEVFSPNSAAVLWDHFPPMACDIHAAAYSQVMMVMMI